MDNKMNIIFEKYNDTTLRTNAPYQQVREHIQSSMLSLGGKQQKDDDSKGIIEFSWRYGVNPFGMRVTAQFRTIEEDSIEINFKGGFKDSFDTTGAGKKKAYEVIDEVLGYSDIETKTNESNMPPRLGNESVSNRGKSKVLAGILALLLGGFGAHKFYLGSWGLGLIYLFVAFFMPFLTIIVAAIEGIRYFTLSDNDFNEKYNYCELAPFEFKW